MYKKTNWKARKGANLNRFEKSQETERFVILENKPNSVTELGTPFSVANMNKIEDGIADAHEMIDMEEQSRIEGDKETLEAAQAYTDEAQLATQTWLPAVNTVAALDEITGLNKNINYLCRVIKDHDISKNGVYQCIAGWEEEPVWSFFSDNADWIDENEMAQAIADAVNEHNTNTDAHKNIQDAIADEAQTRADAIITEALARDHAVTEEAQTRATADNTLQGNINDTNGNIANLRYDFNAWIGRGGYLEAHDFGTYLPTQEELTNQALAQISTINDPLQIWNGTKIVNLFNNYLWVLTNTPNTNPPIFEWTNQGTSDLTPFMEDRGGYIVGANENDPPEYIRPLLNGKGKIDLEGIKRQFEKGEDLSEQSAKYGQSKRDGVSLNWARADHYHELPIFPPDFYFDNTKSLLLYTIPEMYIPVYNTIPKLYRNVGVYLKSFYSDDLPENNGWETIGLQPNSFSSFIDRNYTAFPDNNGNVRPNNSYVKILRVLSVGPYPNLTQMPIQARFTNETTGVLEARSVYNPGNNWSGVGIYSFVYMLLP